MSYLNMDGPVAVCEAGFRLTPPYPGKSVSPNTSACFDHRQRSEVPSVVCHRQRKLWRR